jgi:hypothetical protein
MNQIYEQYSQDPDETFKMYVDRLMKAKPRFGGTFATPPQQGQDATSKATGGLLTGLFPEYADRMGGGGGGSDMPSVNSGSAPSAPGARGNFASAEDVLGSQQFAGQLSDMGRGLGQLGGAVFGPAGMLLGLAPRAAEYYANNQWDSFNRGIDSDAIARAEAMGLGGLGTYSDQQGNLGTFSSPSLIADYNSDVFGPGANLESLDSDYYAQTYNTPDMVGPSPSPASDSGGSYDYGGSGGWGTSDHSDYGDGGYDGSW